MVLTIHFVPEFGVKALGYGIFHSISAFCNAGFDLFGNYDSLCYFLMTCIALLIIFGGIGFTVIADFVNRRRWKKFSLHTKIVVVMNVALIVGGTLLIFAVEYYNPDTVGNMSIPAQLAQAESHFHGGRQNFCHRNLCRAVEI